MTGPGTPVFSFNFFQLSLSGPTIFGTNEAELKLGLTGSTSRNVSFYYPGSTVTPITIMALVLSAPNTQAQTITFQLVDLTTSNVLANISIAQTVPGVVGTTETAFTTPITGLVTTATILSVESYYTTTPTANFFDLYSVILY